MLSNEEELPAMVRQLTKNQLLERIKDIRLTLQADQPFTRLQRGHLIQLLLLWETYQKDELTELDTLITLVKSVKLQSEAFRGALLWDLRGYAGASQEDRRKTKDRVFKALQGAPPVDPRKDDVEALTIGGNDIQQPERFRD